MLKEALQAEKERYHLEMLSSKGTESIGHAKYVGKYFLNYFCS